MSVTFLHTADWQLGKPFASVRDEAKRHRLQQERFDAVRRLADLIKGTGATFVLVAGDLFDSSQPTKSIVSAACAAIGSLGVPVLAIPGNHDHGGPGSLWEQEFFQREREQLAPNLRILLTPEPLVLEHAVIFPAPLLRRHESTDPTAWIRTVLDGAGLPKIVLAHGTVQGFGAAHDDDEADSIVANWIDISRLAAADYIALGDWHGTRQVAANAWYSGTPEIDRFPKGSGNDPGNVLRVTLATDRPAEVVKIPTSRFQWREIAHRFATDDDLDLLASRLDETGGDGQLLLLTLEGSLGMAASARLEEILEAWDSRLLRLKLDRRVTIAPTDVEIMALTGRAADPLISSVARQLVTRIDSEESRLALRELHAHLASIES